MAEIVDPRPQVEAKLRELAAQFEPQLEALRREMIEAPSTRERRQLKRRLSEVKTAYRDARRTVTAILRAPIAW
jgi:hypothetical protein